ncbi:hypothetical protein GUITHDRAFT_165660 [Guillardia theta CCMP2712]|uniref:Deoxyhypusine monooxygenase n=1 Tax=Guillardia theta (strain CCMP2712) TaxID=905079 RepID=L1IKZ8_GUITC|nr:hypothetical protein GUITHDRAFT_165660 [Guillardia theta CCMP2712]EKX36782.1 hypothetical protein GUITHDRAFT_165660 [Guillardia theta CCMP2712]|eukprot:XP_005823762.1 hypothetical protein GUITHDRAFT_165660 [Guillardia theta CCMP2712]
MAGRIAPALLVVLLDLLLDKSAGTDGSMINLQWHAEPYHSLLQLRRLRLRGGEEMKLSKKMEVLWDRANTARMMQEKMHEHSDVDNKDLSRLVEEIREQLNTDSALLRHEVCYALGQTRSAEAVPILREILQDRSEEAIVRHEAAESEFVSVDPAPAFGKSDNKPEGQKSWISQVFLDQKRSLFDRYRALFSLRNLGGPECVKGGFAICLLGQKIHRDLLTVICEGVKDPNALFRHEVAFVLGQISDPEALPALQSLLENSTENSMVRHEAAEAIGGMGLVECRELLERYLHDKDPVVSQSCEVALDMTSYWKEFKEARV